MFEQVKVVIRINLVGIPSDASRLYRAESIANFDRRNRVNSIGRIQWRVTSSETCRIARHYRPWASATDNFPLIHIIRAPREKMWEHFHNLIRGIIGPVRMKTTVSAELKLV